MKPPPTFTLPSTHAAIGWPCVTCARPFVAGDRCWMSGADLLHHDCKARCKATHAGMRCRRPAGHEAVDGVESGGHHFRRGS